MKVTNLTVYECMGFFVSHFRIPISLSIFFFDGRFFESPTIVSKRWSRKRHFSSMLKRNPPNIAERTQVSALRTESRSLLSITFHSTLYIIVSLLLSSTPLRVYFITIPLRFRFSFVFCWKQKIRRPWLKKNFFEERESNFGSLLAKNLALRTFLIFADSFYFKLTTFDEEIPSKTDLCSPTLPRNAICLQA